MAVDLAFVRVRANSEHGRPVADVGLGPRSRYNPLRPSVSSMYVPQGSVRNALAKPKGPLP